MYEADEENQGRSASKTAGTSSKGEWGWNLADGENRAGTSCGIECIRQVATTARKSSVLTHMERIERQIKRNAAASDRRRGVSYSQVVRWSNLTDTGRSATYR